MTEQNVQTTVIVGSIIAVLLFMGTVTSSWIKQDQRLTRIEVQIQVSNELQKNLSDRFERLLQQQNYHPQNKP